MYFDFAGQTLPIATATLDGNIPDPFQKKFYPERDYDRSQWGLDILTDDAAIQSDDPDIPEAPCLCHHGLTFDIASWREIAGATFSWTSASTPSEISRFGYDPNGTFGLSAACPILQSQLTFGMTYGTRIKTQWKGRVDMSAENRSALYGPTTFKAYAGASLTHIVVEGTTKDSGMDFRRRLARFLDPRDFRQGKVMVQPRPGSRLPAGVSHAACRFLPLLR